MAESESVVVGVRVRPFNDREKGLKAELCVEMDGPTTRLFQSESLRDKGPKFTFDESFWSHDGFEVNKEGYSEATPGSGYHDQNYVYGIFGQRVLDNAWAGFHCCLFAYGQTGSGKSYSMVGYGANKGIVPIATEQIFKRIADDSNQERKYEVICSMVEIYNEGVQDLLILPEDRPKKGLDIRESKLLGIYIDGVTRRPVQSYGEIEATVEEATEHRTVGATLMNATSSRAHTVVNIEFKQVEMVAGKKTEKISMINLVDLAGSEKAGQTGAAGDRLKEGASINKSLSALGNVIEKLAQRSQGKKDVLVPYRDSKLTRLLQNALGGSSKTIMICALSPASSNYEETLSTLRYADRAKKIKNNAKVNENPEAKLLRELKEENNSLKAMMDQFKGGTDGPLDFEALNAKQAEIKQAEEALKQMQRSFEDRYNEDQVKVHRMQVRKSLRGGPRPGVGNVAQAWPYLANLNEDAQLTGRIKHEVAHGPDGAAQTTTIGQLGGSKARTMSTDKSRRMSSAVSMRRMSANGAVLAAATLLEKDEDTDDDGSDSGSASDTSSSDEDDQPDIMLLGAGIFAKHAVITNVGDNTCYMMGKGKAAEATYVSGKRLADLLRAQEDNSDDEQEEGVKLKHGDRVAFGRLLFVFVDPIEGSVEILVVSGQTNYAKAAYEVERAEWKNQRKRRPQELGDRLLGISHHEKSFSDGDMDCEANKVAELRAHLANKDKELDSMRAELTALRTLQAEHHGPRRVDNVKQTETESIKKARGIASDLKCGFDQTAVDLEKAMNSLDVVRRTMQDMSLPLKGKRKALKTASSFKSATLLESDDDG